MVKLFDFFFNRLQEYVATQKKEAVLLLILFQGNFYFSTLNAGSELKIKSAPQKFHPCSPQFPHPTQFPSSSQASAPWLRLAEKCLKIKSSCPENTLPEY